MDIEHKVLISPEFNRFYDKIPFEYTESLLVNIKDGIKQTDRVINSINRSISKNESSDERKADMEQPSDIAIWVAPPKRQYLKPQSARQIKQFAEKISSYYANGSFRNSPQYSDIMQLANSEHNPKDLRKVSKFALGDIEIRVHICYIDISNGNKIKKDLGSEARIVHYTIGFQTDDKHFTGMFPVDITLKRVPRKD